ncbi:MAG: LLM class flavin-dependent oxidoreductase [Actinomycetota bacterium]
MKFGVALGRLHPGFFVDVTIEADRLGYESVWLPEHLVLTTQMSRSPHPGETHPPVPPETPVFDAFTYLGYLAGRTERIRLGTHVYNIGLRHPFTAARGVQTLDILSNGRLEFGIGASWLEEEWTAAELDFHTRGRRVDEAIEVCKRFWTDQVAEYHGAFFSFEGVAFEPKCVQQPWPPRRAVYQELNVAITYHTDGRLHVRAGPSACTNECVGGGT